MAPKILIISDLEFSPTSNGGEESNTFELRKWLKRNEIDAEFITCREFNANRQEKDIYIVSNFYFLNQESKEFLSSRKYIITEHDYKFLLSRNPCLYENFQAPIEAIVNKEFYENAEIVLFQSLLQMKIFHKNGIALRNGFNFSGNLWSEDALNILSELSVQSKNGKACILSEDEYGIKGKDISINFCQQFFLNYDLIPKLDHLEFLKFISKYSSYVFFPRTPETLSRVCIEAKLLNCSVITNNLTAAVHEKFFQLDNKSMVEYLRNKPQELVNIILSV